MVPCREQTLHVAMCNTLCSDSLSNIGMARVSNKSKEWAQFPTQRHVAYLTFCLKFLSSVENFRQSALVSYNDR